MKSSKINKEKKLTLKEQLFVIEYLKDFNATRSAIAAGYSKRSATAIGAENLTKPHILEAITAKVNEFWERSDIEAFRVFTETQKIAFSKITDIVEFEGDKVDIKSSSDIDTTALSQICIRKTCKKNDEIETSYTIKMHDKIKALENLQKWLGFYTEKHEHTGKDGGAILFNVAAGTEEW